MFKGLILAGLLMAPPHWHMPPECRHTPHAKYWVMPYPYPPAVKLPENYWL